MRRHRRWPCILAIGVRSFQMVLWPQSRVVLDVFKEQHGDQPKREGQRTREEGKKKGGKNRGKEG